MANKQRRYKQYHCQDDRLHSGVAHWVHDCRLKEQSRQSRFWNKLKMPTLIHHNSRLVAAITAIIVITIRLRMNLPQTSR